MNDERDDAGAAESAVDPEAEFYGDADATAGADGTGDPDAKSENAATDDGSDTATDGTDGGETDADAAGESDSSEANDDGVGDGSGGAEAGAIENTEEDGVDDTETETETESTEEAGDAAGESGDAAVGTAETPETVDETALRAAATALWRGDLVVYPTETVYGLAADALDERAVRRVFETKGRDSSDPVSIAVPDVTTALEYVAPSGRTRRFMRAFLPGPVTVVCERRDGVPDVVTAGRDRVGVRVPDDPTAMALLRRVAPLTATSANVSGAPNARRVAEVDDAVREAAAVVLGGGETPGGESTVVDVGRDEVIRAGRRSEAVREWLDEH